jgi:hypothetical protein
MRLSSPLTLLRSRDALYERRQCGSALLLSPIHTYKLPFRQVLLYAVRNNMQKRLLWIMESNEKLSANLLVNPIPGNVSEALHANLLPSFLSP